MSEDADRLLPPQRVAELHEQGEATVVDVRDDDEHAAGHIAGDRHVPFERLTDEVDSLDPDKPVVFYCRSGDRSVVAAEAFAASGREAHSMEGGLLAWAEVGEPLEPEDGSVIERSGLPPT